MAFHILKIPAMWVADLDVGANQKVEEEIDKGVAGEKETRYPKILLMHRNCQKELWLLMS
jgi:hypothetical protein